MIRQLLSALTLAAIAAVPALAAGMDDATAKMHEAHQHDAPVPSAATEIAPKVPVDGADVVYATVGGQQVKGYLARPKDAKSPLPALIVIHEWWGLNDNIRAMARRLAGEGYTALAVDLYGGQAAADPDAATKLMQGVMANPSAANENLKAAYEFLKAHEKAPKVGTIGWCFGGGWSLATALLLPDKVSATVMYYGRVVTDPKLLAPLQMPILGLFGGADQSITEADVKAFEAALQSAGKKASIKIYPGAKHAFANASGKSYDPVAATDAWKLATAFLAANLQK